MKDKNIYGVYLGRFAPPHIGHQMIIDKMISEFGIGNSIIMVGSSNAYNTRTPYTFDERKTMISAIYPKIKIIPIPDMKAHLLKFDGTTDALWLSKLKIIENEMGGKFIFLGGSEEDLKVLAKMFETNVLINRVQNGLNISATEVRRAMDNNDLDKVRGMLDPKVYTLALHNYKKYKQSEVQK